MPRLADAIRAGQVARVRYAAPDRVPAEIRAAAAEALQYVADHAGVGAWPRRTACGTSASRAFRTCIIATAIWAFARMNRGMSRREFWLSDPRASHHVKVQYCGWRSASRQATAPT